MFCKLFAEEIMKYNVSHKYKKWNRSTWMKHKMEEDPFAGKKVL